MCMECKNGNIEVIGVKGIEYVQEIIESITESIKEDNKIHNGETKVCKTCGVEKPVGEFSKNKCKVCGWLDRHTNLVIKQGWNISEYKIILDSLINRKVYYLNDLAIILNKDLGDLCDLLSKHVIIGGCFLQIKNICPICDKEFDMQLANYIKNDIHYCSKSCMEESRRETIDVLCDNCGKTISVNPCKFKVNKHFFCSKNCDIEYKKNNKVQIANYIQLNCDNCGKKYEITEIAHLRSINHFCSIPCRQEYNTKNSVENTGMKTCVICNELKSINEFHSQSSKCHICDYLNKHKDLKILENWTIEEYKIIIDCIFNKKVKCVNDILPLLNNKSLYDICNLIYKELKIQCSGYPVKVKQECKECGKDFYMKVNEYLKGEKILCSKDCSYKWYSRNYKQENNPNWKRVTCECEWCKKPIVRKLNHYNKNQNNFCSYGCSREYFKNVYSQTDEFRERSRGIALNNLKNGVYKTDSAPQKITNLILEDLNIIYENEKILDYYSIDNYITDYGLAIEVQGDYWHCNINEYDNIKLESQINQIYKDKAKHTFILNKYKINILYLWEFDLNNNVDICIELVNEYIKNKGILKNYNSFNYSFIDNKLILNKKIIKSYAEHSKEYTSSKLDLSIKEKPEFYIRFICETCGKESSQLIKKYNKQSHHFCCRDCSNIFRAKNNREFKTTIFNCENCGKEIIRGNSTYDNAKHHFCGKECYDKWQTKNIQVKCECCKKEILVSEVNFKRNITGEFFCNRECYDLNRKIKLVTFECDQCGKEKTIPQKQFNTYEHHYCSNKCNLEWNKLHRNKNEKGQFC